MTTSIQILQSYKVAQVTKMSISGLTLILEGGRYTNTRFVAVNGMRIDTIRLVGSKLYVTLPKALTLKDILFVAPMGDMEKVGKDSLLRLSTGVYPKKTSGIERLIQLFVKILYSTRGSDILNPAVGGGLISITKRGYTTGDGQRVIPEIVASISKADSDIKEMQKSIPLPQEERLVEAKLLSATMDANSGSVDCIVSLISQKGEVGAFCLSF